MSSSPTACLTPPCSRTSSATSACPEAPSNRVNGARIGAVTGSLAIRRASRKVATVSRSGVADAGSARAAPGPRRGPPRPPRTPGPRRRPSRRGRRPAAARSPLVYSRFWVRAHRRTGAPIRWTSSAIAMARALPPLPPRKPARPGVRHGTPTHARRAPGRAASRTRPARPRPRAARTRAEGGTHDAARGPDRPRHLPRGRGHPRGRAGRLPHQRAGRGPRVRPAARRAPRRQRRLRHHRRSSRPRASRSTAGWPARSRTTRPTSAPAEDPQRAVGPARAGPGHRRRRRTPAPSAPPTTSRPPPTPRSAARAPRRAPSTSPTADRRRRSARADPGSRPPGVGWHGLVRLSTFVIAVQQAAAPVPGSPRPRHPFDHLRNPGTSSSRTAQR